MLSEICFSSTGCGASAKNRSSVGSISCSLRPYHWDRPGEIAQGRGNFQQLTHREDAPLAGVGNDAAHLAHAAEAGTAVLDEQRVDALVWVRS